SPDGITITLSSGNGGAHPNVFAAPGTIWTDLGALDHPPVPVAEYPFANNTVAPRLAPEEALGELVGQTGYYYWVLHVDNTGGQSGQVGDVILQLEQATCLPDLYTYRSTSASYPRVGRPFRVRLETDNYGTNATNVIMTGTFPTALKFQSVAPFD